MCFFRNVSSYQSYIQHCDTGIRFKYMCIILDCYASHGIITVTTRIIIVTVLLFSKSLSLWYMIVNLW